MMLLACVLPLLQLARDPAWAMIVLIPTGLLLSAPTSSLVVLGQGYLPNHIGLSSGVTMGLAFSFGGVTMPLLGLVADHYGLRTALSVVAFIPMICIGLLLALPRSGHAGRQEARGL
jgi:MFS transporter, FSR family, fosmidomycin resistance protein